MPRKLLALVVATLSVLVVAAVPGRAARASTPVVFRVGAAVRSIDPPTDVYAGGFGASPPIRRVFGHLQVRALFVQHGASAVAFAVVDAQAEFAAYQEGSAYGISDARRVAAQQLDRLGLHVS